MAEHLLPVKLDCKTQVCNAAGSIFLYQDVFTLQVPVCNGRLALCPIDFCVQVAQATRSRIGQLEQSPVVQRSALQKIIQ